MCHYGISSLPMALSHSSAIPMNSCNVGNPGHKPIMTGVGDLGGRRSFAANPTPGANCAAAALAEAAEGRGTLELGMGMGGVVFFLSGACHSKKKVIERDLSMKLVDFT